MKGRVTKVVLHIYVNLILVGLYEPHHVVALAILDKSVQDCSTSLFHVYIKNIKLDEELQELYILSRSSDMQRVRLNMWGRCVLRNKLFQALHVLTRYSVYEKAVIVLSFFHFLSLAYK